MNINNKITKAKVGIILDHPFFATLMLKKTFISDETIKTTATNGDTIRYNPDYVEKLSFEQLKGVVCHDLMHTAFLHHIRREGRDPAIWNKATDYAVNQMIIDSGMALPEGYLINPNFKEMAAESIYNLLPGPKPKDDKSGGEDGDGDELGCGDVQDAPSDKSLREQEAEAKQQVAQAMQIAKQQGKLPAGLQRIVEELLQAKVPWKEVLARFLTEPAKNDYSFSKPNVRYLGSGFILPSLHSLEIAEVMLFVDTSGSIDDELLEQFAGEMQEICSTYNCPITVLYIDTKVAGDERIEPDDVFKLDPKGGSGTDFRPGFKWLEERNIVPKSVVYFTDGCCSSFPEEPEYPVLWAQWGEYKFNPPFGEVIKIT